MKRGGNKNPVGSLRSTKRYLIVVEGKKTEMDYFRKINAERISLGRTKVHVEVVHSGGTDPETLVNFAKSKEAERIQRGKKGLQKAYDEIWVVMDTEEESHTRRTQLHTLDSFNNPGESTGRAAISCITFDAWLFLHVRRWNRPMTKDKIKRDQEECFQERYEKALPMKLEDLKGWDFFNLVEEAVANAKLLEAENLRNSPDVKHPNPSTTVHHLVEKLIPDPSEQHEQARQSPQSEHQPPSRLDGA